MEKGEHTFKMILRIKENRKEIHFSEKNFVEFFFIGMFFPFLRIF